MPTILVVNAGSSSLKWSVLTAPGEITLASGNEPLPAGAAPDLRAIAARLPPVDAVGHRVVHGGPALRATARVDARVRAAMLAARPLDPLHTDRALACIDAVEAALPGVPQYTCFDTGFHATLPEPAARYAVPWAWTEKFDLRRYGFHGLSVAYALGRAAEMLGRGARESKLVVCHLGSGCSVTGVSGGRSADTTMGLTPLEGVVMATRSGSVDPGMLLYLMREAGMSPLETEEALEKHSGLLGVSGVSADLREVLRAADAGNARAALAYAMFVHSVRRAVGQMLGATGGWDALVFTGGIGEHSARTRRDVAEAFGWAGVAVDGGNNDAASGDADVSAAGARVRVLVVTAREDLTIAREVARVL